MAASAATAVGSSFSPSFQRLKFTHAKHLYPWDSLSLKVSASALITLLSISRSHAISVEPLSVGAVSSWRVSRVCAAVAQEETVAIDASVQEEQEGAEGDGEVAVEGVEEEAVKTKLYFGNLPYNVDSAQLAGIIQEYANPELVEVLYHRETGKSRGFAFATMSSIEDCNWVIQNLNASQFMGRILRVNFANRPTDKEPLYPESEHKLFIGNLSWSATSESLTEAFQAFGNVVGARVLYDGETGRSRGYGFVCFSTKSEMEAALESLDGVKLDGRPMRVSLALGRKSGRS